MTALDPCQDQAAIEALIELGLAQMASNEPLDSDTEVNGLSSLQRCANQMVFEAVKQLCASPIPERRAFGADILGQLGVIEGNTLRHVFREERIEFLLTLLATETDPNVLHSIGIALGHLEESRAIPGLVKYKNHPEWKVRYGVLAGLTGLEDDLAIQTLIELSQDEHDMIRDWATFGLGSQIELDTPAIREALYRNVQDSDFDTRNEALLGLALRQDRRIIPQILELMADRTQAMMSYQYSDFCAVLKALQAEIDDPRLADILAECDSEGEPI